MKQKRVIVACNNGVATSEAVVYKLKGLLESKGVTNMELLAVDIKSVESYLHDADAYVCLIRPDKDYGLPIIDGIKILTGVGADTEVEKLVEIARN